MDYIIGLGKQATKLARMFQQKLPEFYENVWTFSHEKEKEKTHFTLPVPSTIEGYEELKLPPKTFFQLLPEQAETLFIIYGEEKITAYSLRLLETIKDRKITILYIRPDIKELDFEGKKTERVFYNVFQELTRSGRFEKVLLFSIPDIEDTIPDLTLLNYKEKLNNAIIDIIHQFNFYNHQEPLKENQVSCPIGARIGTLGVMNFEEGQDFWFFPLDEVSFLFYHLVVGEEMLENDKDLLTKIKKQMSLRRKKFGEHRVRFAIQKGTQETIYGIVMPASAGIQKE